MSDIRQNHQGVVPDPMSVMFLLSQARTVGLQLLNGSVLRPAPEAVVVGAS